MPTPYPDPFTGLTEGLKSGIQMGLAVRQQKQAEEEGRFNRVVKYLQLGVEYGKVKNPVYKNAGLEFYKKAIKEGGDLIGLDASAMPQDLTWNEGFDEINNEISAALNAYQNNNDRVTLGKALTSAYKKAGDTLESEQLKTLEETTGATVKSIEEAQKPPGGMDALLAQRVTKGELTLEEAFTMKKKGEAESQPYKIGQRHKYVGNDGKTYEGTYQGLDPKTNEPIWSNVKKTAEDKDYGERYSEWEQTFIKQIGRAPSEEEKRQRLLQDPFGIFSPAEDEALRLKLKGAGDIKIYDRFNADPSMKGLKIGEKKHPKYGYEVYDDAGKLKGYYK